MDSWYLGANTPAMGLGQPLQERIQSSSAWYLGANSLASGVAQPMQVARLRCQLRRAVQHPMTIRSHKHSQLIQAIVNELENRAEPVHFYKVKAHANIIGNEGADAVAKWAARHPTECDVTVEGTCDPFEEVPWLQTTDN